MTSVYAGARLSPSHTNLLFYGAPLIATVAGALLANTEASAFALITLILWALIRNLLLDGVRYKDLWIKIATLSPWIVLAFSAAVLVLTPYNHSLPKFVYSAMTLTIIIGFAARCAIGWTDSATPLKKSVIETAAFLILTVWLIYGDSNWYLTIVMPYGVPDTTPHLLLLPWWWWLACFVVPCLLIARLASIGELASVTPRSAQLIAVDMGPRVTRAVYISGALLVLLMTLLQTLAFTLHRFGHLILEGDEFGYVVSAYQLLEQGFITPPHMPLISLYIAAVFAAAGDNPTAILFTNTALALLTVALMMGALRLITSDLRLILLSGVLLASLRTLYLYIWTPLTETLNNFLWASAIFLLIAAVRRPGVLWHVTFGIVISLLLLARSQNVGGVVGIGLSYILLVFLFADNRRAIPAWATVGLLFCTLLAASGPLIGWGYYRQQTIGKFQIMDGRGAEVLLGMNTPGVAYGLSADAWVGNVEKWRASHPGATTPDLLLGALRYRLENPKETVSYVFYRALEFLNLRFIMVNSRFENAIKPNVQLFILIASLIGLFAFRGRWLPTGITILFFSFMGIFLIIYSEARYRIPMDPLLTIGAGVLLSRMFFRSDLPLPVRTPLPSDRSPVVRFATAAIFCCLMIGGMRIVATAASAAQNPYFTGAELRPLGAKIVSGPPVNLKDFENLPTWEELLKTNDAASLQGKMFRGRFGLVGSLFKAGNLVLYENNNVAGAEIHNHAIPQDQFYRAHSTAQPLEGEMPYNRMAIAFDGATIEAGIRQRGVIELIGRVRPLPRYYDEFFKLEGFLFVDAIYAVCSPEARRQPCAR